MAPVLKIRQDDFDMKQWSDERVTASRPVPSSQKGSQQQATPPSPTTTQSNPAASSSDGGGGWLDLFNLGSEGEDNTANTKTVSRITQQPVTTSLTFTDLPSTNPTATESESTTAQSTQSSDGISDWVLKAVEKAGFESGEDGQTTLPQALRRPIKRRTQPTT
ncbi:hypothetical protein QFC22_006494 [Naganishia vaughanmartiniae]|uniref:Uncharacterized protein n=1 Tax=Naganishia vaughanmartiniae TaxID=1424756 RepID=A0ACC2WJL8_9TREE|nr:hypothetical protein QFC22_006494 [Naganishia vaughanmartiniae]